MRLASLTVALGALLAIAPASAAPRRFAIVIGANVGDPWDVRLHYAEDDARRVASVLKSVGEFEEDDVTVLTGGGVRDLSHALDQMGARLDGHRGEKLLFLFYSGHGDAESLHLAGGRFPVAELRDFANQSIANVRVLVIDACRSGAVTRVKGGTAGPSFDVRIEAPLGAQGTAILTSSTAGEDSQESDDLHGSFFSHYFASGLIGAADKNADGSVSIEEAFSYASERTLSATAGTRAGPQHPTYRYDLGGRDELVLTRPGQLNYGMGVVQFPRAGWFILRKGDGPVMAELHADEAGHRLALAPGRYRFAQRLPSWQLEGEVTVTAGVTSQVSLEQLRRVEYAPVIRKGSDELVADRPTGAPRGTALYVAGLALFAAAYVPVTAYALVATIDRVAVGPMSNIPIYGAIIHGAFEADDVRRGFAGSSTAAALLILDGVVQQAGMIMTVIGDVQRRASRPRVVPSPWIVPGGGGGFTWSGTF